MSTHTNVSGEDRIVSIDGRAILVTAGEQFTVDDIHDDSLAEQPYFEIAAPPKGDAGKNKSAPAGKADTGPTDGLEQEPTTQSEGDN